MITSQPPWFLPTGLPLGVDDRRNDARQRLGAAARLGGDRAGQRAHHDAARFGLPPGIDDRAPLAADLAVIPHPRFGVDAFADGAQQPQARQIVLLDVLVAPLDERANRRRGGVEDRDLVLLDDLPEAAFIRAVRRAFVHQDRRAGGERAVDDVAVAGDPAEIGGAPEDVVVAMIEDPLKRFLDEQVVAGGRVLDALRFAGGAAGVEDEQRRFAVERRRRGNRPTAFAISSCHQWSRPACMFTWVPLALPVPRSAEARCTFRRSGLLASASSTVSFSGSALPRRQPPSAVICSLACASWLRSAIASAEKPAKITEWIAPMRAQASMAIASSGTIGM